MTLFSACSSASAIVSTKNKVNKADLAEVQSDFAAEFHREYIVYGKECVYNVDETGIYKISSGEKHSLRMKAVLSVQADGTQLHIVFIMKGVPGGCIDSSELSTSLPAIFIRL
ncbi:hypothetical protein DYB28_002810 [Aphanomyces astaci]|uniref:DDE-1 domain-containing protein n=1 Tax=Aphanomyces astaci TaxID=112090 RepID=A0A397B1M1_APHAT|nr:hypothetical protein DYB36_008476 [Aphanomyces astaci]RHY39909.1 hypothetical protein DYB38_011655 [Aphanomyces astaci]RHY74225.1 hypothetical protein DYB34_010287 [Aphanomyces astaci]RHZ01157.1 hypothetical protein DYB31_014584 [Aphanomyces astaci]RHZ27046.1 hypothetical protein DYB26_006397 [Aphanomyces astaci]